MAPSKPDPMGSYAALEVERPSLAGQAFIVVSNEVDFRHLWELYKQRRVADDEEVLLGYAPVDQKRLGRLMGVSLPCLDIMVYPKATLRRRTIRSSDLSFGRLRYSDHRLGRIGFKRERDGYPLNRRV